MAARRQKAAHWLVVDVSPSDTERLGAVPADPAGPAPRRPTARVAIAAAVAAVVTVGAWQTGDWWAQGYPGLDRNLTIARLMLAGLAGAAAWAVPPLLRRMDRRLWIVFGAWIAYLVVWVVGLWPGVLMTDSVDLMVNARQGIVYDWFSPLQSLFDLAVLDVVPQVAALVILQALGLAALMTYASALVLRRGGRLWAVALMNVLTALSPPVIVAAVLFSRDTAFGLLHVALALYLADCALLRRRLTPGGLAGIALTTGALSMLRGDGIVLVAVVPLVLLAGLRPRLRPALLGAAAFAAAFLLFHAVLPRATSVRQDNPHFYALSLKLNPLGHVLRTRFHSDDRARDLRELGRVIDVQAVRDLSTPLEIPAYWQGKYRADASEADWKAFDTTANRLIRHNLSAVLKGRLKTLAASTGLDPGGFKGTPEPTAAEHLAWVPDRSATGMAGSPPLPGLYRFEARMLYDSTISGGAISRARVLWDFLPFLALLVVALLLAWRWAFEGAFAVIVLARVPLVCAAAPAAQFKYYLSVHVGGLVLLGLLAARVRPDHARQVVRATVPAGVRRSPLVVRLVKFGGASGGGLALDYAIYTALCAGGLPAGFANLVSAAAGVTFVYVVSVRHVFERVTGVAHRRLFATYAGYQALAIPLASVAVGLLTEVFDGRYVLGKTAVLPVTFAANYLFMSWLLGPRQRRLQNA